MTGTPTSSGACFSSVRRRQLEFLADHDVEQHGARLMQHGSTLRFRHRSRRNELIAGGAQNRLQHSEIGGLVIEGHDGHASRLQPLGLSYVLVARGCPINRGNGDRECGTFPGRALHSDFTAEQFGEPLGQRQAEASALELML